MRKHIIIIIITLGLLLCSCNGQRSINISDKNETSIVNFFASNNSEENSQNTKIPIFDSSDTSGIPYQIGDFLFSNTGAKTEDFIVYDGTAKQSLLPTEFWQGCKIHCEEYHCYASFGIDGLRTKDDSINFSQKYHLSEKLINGKSPVCEGYNQIQMIWDLGITTSEVEQLLGSYDEFCIKLKKLDYSEKQLLSYKAYYMGPCDKLTDADLDFIQKT